MESHSCHNTTRNKAAGKSNIWHPRFGVTEIPQDLESVNTFYSCHQGWYLVQKNIILCTRSVTKPYKISIKRCLTLYYTHKSYHH